MIRIKVRKTFFLVSCVLSLLGESIAQNADIMKVNALCDSSFMRNGQGKYEEAKKYAESALALAKQIPYKDGTALSYSRISQAYSHLGKLPLALENSFSALEIYQAIKDTFNIGMANSDIGNNYSMQGNDSAALRYYNFSLKIYKSFSTDASSDVSVKSKYNIGTLLLSIGNIYNGEGKDSLALINYLTAFQIGQELGEFGQKIVEASCVCIGSIYMKQEKYSEALERYLFALQISQERNDKQVSSDCYANIGEIYYQKNKYKEAMKNYSEGLKISEEMDYKGDRLKSYINIGIINGVWGNYGEEITNSYKALVIATSLGYKEKMVDAYNNLALAFGFLGNYDSLLANAKTALVIAKEINYEYGIADSYDNQEFYYEKKKDLVEAKKYAELGLSTAKESKYSDVIVDSYNSLGNIDKAEGRDSLALKNYRMALTKAKEVEGENSEYLEGIVDSYNNIGSIYLKEYESSRLHRNDLALDNYSSALAIAKEINYQEGIADATINEALIYKWQRGKGTGRH